MIGESRVLALVPARGGSKGFPGKNLARLGGKSLLARAIDAAKGSAFVDHVLVSSDDEAICAEGLRAGADVPFFRPAELSTDTASTASVVIHALQNAGFEPDFLVLLQPTSPLRSSEDIDRCIRACHETGAVSAVSVVESDKSPFIMYWKSAEGLLSPVAENPSGLTRRQDLAPAYLLNGAVYVRRVDDFLKNPVFAPAGTIGVLMPKERSVDIDTESDLEAAAALLRSSATEAA